MSTDELREKIARTLDYLHDPWPGGIDAEWEQGRRADGYRIDADAILPIVEAEVRKAKAEALRDAADSVQDNAASPYCLPCHRDDADLLRTIAAEHETGDQR